MDKLMDFLCDEIDELERKAGKDGKLSMAEIQYLDTLAHTKKNLMKAEEMSDEGYSSRGYSRRGGVYEGMYEGSYDDGSYRGSYEGRGRSYARGRGRNARRDSMGRYSSRGYSMASEDMVNELRDLMNDAPDEHTRKEFEKFINKIESM